MVPENLNGDSLRPKKRKPTDTSSNKRTSRKRENTKWKQRPDQKPHKQNTSNPGQNRSQTEPIQTEKKSNHARTSSSDTLTLTPTERADLDRREKIIEDEAVGSHLRIGEELLGIMELGYHRKLGHKTIEAYALTRFGSKVGSSHRNVQRLLDLARAAPKIRKCPNGHVIPLEHEGPVRDLIARHKKPDFEECVENVALMVNRSVEQGKDPKNVTGSMVQRAVNDAVIEHRINEHQLRPKTTKELAKGFHVSKVEDGLKFIADGEVNLTFTSFPYGCGLKYTSHGKPIWDDSIPLSKLLEHYKQWMFPIHRITNPLHGRVGINISDIYGAHNDMTDDDVVYLDHEVDKIVKANTDLKRFGKIIWDKGSNNALSKAHGSVASWSSPSIERQAEIILLYYRGNRQRPNDPDRKDMDNAEYMRELQKNVWFCNAGCGVEIHKTHPCPFPLKLAENAIRFLTAPPGADGEMDVCCDPFGGSGTLAHAAFKLGRRSIYNDASEEYAHNAMDRIAKVMATLRKK